MNKFELAAYLVNLHTLMDAQFANPVADVSQTLAAEYEKHWGLLKEAIAKENGHEARKSQFERKSGSEDGASIKRYQP